MKPENPQASVMLNNFMKSIIDQDDTKEDTEVPKPQPKVAKR